MNKSIYEFKQWWTVFFIVIAVGIIITTVVVSNSFSAKLAQDERDRVEIWGEAMHLLASDSNDTTQIMNLILNVVRSNNSIPVIVCEENGAVNLYANIEAPEKNSEEFFQKKIAEFKARNEPIIIQFPDGSPLFLYYGESLVLKRLMMYPYIQLAIVFIFILVSFFALVSAKKAEQNKVWVGLSKETAHQLGTPISSLMAWVEYLKTKEVDGTYLKEMEKDVKRLETVADRFSKIGSNPADLLPLNINNSIRSTYEYMSARISSKIKISVETPEQPALVLMNDSLFSWVIENLTNNAVDAIGGQGSIVYQVENNRKKIYVDVTDTGKGISKSRFKTIFNPGYTTKKRGWGLGLSLVKRIIESYGGKIYVKNSEIGKGTTFRIELPKYHG